jgi:hypothetical protein
MTYDHPRTPQSPSQIASSMHDLPPKPPSPTTNNSLPTPAHSINGSMSSSTGSGFSSEIAQVDGASNKRKRDIEDHGDQEQKKVHVEDSRISIEDLHLNVGKKYLLCRTRKTPFFSLMKYLGSFDVPNTLLTWNILQLTLAAPYLIHMTFSRNTR